MIYILIPVFKRLRHTIKFVDSCNANITEDKNFIIVDDSPDCEHLVHFKNHNKITVLRGNGDLWWGGSINLGLEYLNDHSSIRQIDILIMANNDGYIEENTWPSIKEHYIEDNNSLYHPRVFNLAKQEIKSGANLKTWIPFRAHYIINPQQALTQVDFITGRFLCMKWEVAQEIGMISKNLPHYGGDWDYSLRAKKKGYKTYMVRSSICYVDEATTGTRYEKGISIKAFYHALFTDIKSPQNTFYKYQFFSNHNSKIKTVIATFVHVLKTVIKYVLNKF